MFRKKAKPLLTAQPLRTPPKNKKQKTLAQQGPGIGDGFIPKNLDQSLLSGNVIVTDDEALQTARNLALLEGLPAGISSGTNVACALRLAKELGPGKVVVTVLPDSYDRYFTTPLFDFA